MYEKDMKIYSSNPNASEWTLLYDFSIEVGDQLYDKELDETFTAKSISLISRAGRMFTKIKLKDTQGQQVVWFSGVGASKDLMDPFANLDGDDAEFVSCEINGETIFTAEDFHLPDIDLAYHPMIEDGKVWKVGAGNSGNPVQWVQYYYFDGDTIIDGRTFKQMMCQQYVSPDHPDYDIISQYPLLSYVGAWYEEYKRVYLYDSTNKQYELMYDFSLEDNGYFQANGLSYVVGLKQTGGIQGFKGVYRDVKLSVGGEQGYNTTWLVGVGGIDGPLRNVYLGEENHTMFLMSCAVGDEVIYLNDEYEDGATPEGAEARNRFDFTHTIKNQPHSPMRGEAEPSIYGEYNELLLSINLNPLDDAYMVRITNESGKAVYKKAINAGNIVGLNIDISGYAKGRYTVTVENSRESFTGVFEAQMTGIGLTPTLSKGEGAIFDLQGRQLQGKPDRGVYIQDGRKVVIK